MKKTRNLALCNTLLAVLFLVAAGGSRVMAQSASNAIGAAQLAPVPSRITQAIDETQLAVLKGTVHPLARPEFDRGAVSDSTPMNRMLFFLKRSPDQEAALQQLMAEQMSKASPNFHQWLTPAQFGGQFGPSGADIQAISGWLSAQGFHDLKVGTGKLTIEFSGNVGLVRHAFHTDIHHFEVNGEMRQANVSDPQIPAALTPVVAGIVSLHNFPKKSMRHSAGAFTRTADGRIISQLTGSTNQFFAVGPADFAKIYNIPSTLNGTGSKIAIIGFSDIDPNDVQDFRTLFGLPNNPPNIVHNGPAPGIIGEEGEADLDVEWSGGVAPMAQIDFVVTEDTLTAGGLEMSALYVVDNNSDDIMSLSFGECEAALGSENGFLNALFEQAAAQGISVTVSAGDPGSAGCDDFNNATVATRGLAANGLASTPFDIAVGGTDFDDVTNQATYWNLNPPPPAPPTANDPVTKLSAKGYIPETTWNDSCAAAATVGNLSVCANATNIVGGGGGPSGIYSKPSWQTGTGVPTANARNTPDISLFASDGPQSLSFYVVCQADVVGSNSCASSGSFNFLGVGGTSASAPAFAGILALIEQSERTRVPGSSGRQGNANFVLYKIAQQAASNSCNSSLRTDPTQPAPAGCVFNDVTKGNNSVPCAGTSTNCSSTTSGTNGVLVDPAHTTTPAWTTTTGYDLATGLGTVNVTNLASAWGTAVTGFTPTTTTTNVNGHTTQVTITHGAAVTLGATVASGSGTPTGDVSWLAPTSVNGGLAEQTLSSGTATLTNFTFLPGGTYNVKAHYAGDGTFAPSDDSTGVPVVVNKENSRLQFELVTMDPATGNITNPNATTVTYGTYFLRMDILNSTNNACQRLVTGGTTTGCAVDATGTVTLTDNGSPLDGGTFSINSAGHAEDQLSDLTVGAHALSGTYSGDISYNAVTTAVTDNVTVTQAATTNVLSAANSVLANQATTLSAAILTQSISTQGPTGNVTFKDGSTTLGTIAAVPAGATPTTFAGATATLSVSFSTLGTHSITAIYAGDTNYSTSTATAVNVTVNSPGSFTLSSTPLTLSSSTGAAAGSTITVTPSGGFTGNVVVTASTLPPGVTCPSSPLTIPVTGTTAATGTFNCQVAASSSSLSAAVFTPNQTLDAKALPLTADRRVTGKGWWTLSAGTGFAAFFLILLPGGRKRFRAALGLGLVCLLSFTLGCGGGYNGGGGGGGGGPIATTTSMTVSADKVASGTAFTFSVTVTGGNPGGSVQLFDNGAMIGTAATVSGGKAAPSAPALSVGTHSISAHYLGDAYTQASQSGSLNLTVTGSTTVAITTNPAATPAAAAVNVTIN